jgi:hypothetical protein
MALMTAEELTNHVDEVMKNFKGDIVELSNAIGALNVGRFYGWRVLRIIISNASYRKYQRILGLEFKTVLPETTDYSKKSAGYMLVMKAERFWDAVNNVFKIDSKEKTNFTDLPSH